MAFWIVLSLHTPETTEETHKENSVTVAGVSKEIRSRHLMKNVRCVITWATLLYEMRKRDEIKACNFKACLYNLTFTIPRVYTPL
jgi:hypothetical protein